MRHFPGRPRGIPSGLRRGLGGCLFAPRSQAGRALCDRRARGEPRRESHARVPTEHAHAPVSRWGSAPYRFPGRLRGIPRGSRRDPRGSLSASGSQAGFVCGDGVSLAPESAAICFCTGLATFKHNSGPVRQNIGESGRTSFFRFVSECGGSLESSALACGVDRRRAPRRSSTRRRVHPAIARDPAR